MPSLTIASFYTTASNSLHSKLALNFLLRILVYLVNIFCRTIEIDEFTRNLWQIYTRVSEEGAAQVQKLTL